MDSRRRLYAALPGGTAGDPYGAAVLRFGHDGTVPRSSRAGSPLFARGYAEPRSLVWDAARGALWLSGNRAAWAQGPVAHLAVADESSEWPRVPTSGPLPTSNALSPNAGDPSLVLADRSRGVLRIGGTRERTFVAEEISVEELGGEPTSAVLHGDVMYLSVVTARPNAAPVSQIVRLRRD
jgi:hypothetical protein